MERRREYDARYEARRADARVRRLLALAVLLFAVALAATVAAALRVL